MKTKTLIIITSIVGLLLVGLSIFYTIDYNKRNITEEKEEIVSSIIMDINPSIKINLNKDDEIVSVEALNEDALDIISDDYNGKPLDIVVKDITNNLITKGYTENGITILINTEGNIDDSDVTKIIEESFVDIEVEVKVLVQEVSDTATSEAEKYNISASKASYIEEMIKENDTLTFEDLKDKTIEELENIKNVPEEVEEVEEVVPEPVTQEPSNTNSSTSSSSVGYPDPPSNPLDTSGVWCTWNANRPQWYQYSYSSMIDFSNITNLTMQKLGVSYNDLISNWSGGPIYESKSSYCLAYKSILTTRTNRTTLILDSVTGNVISQNNVAVPTPTVTESQALTTALNHFGLKEEDCQICGATYGVDGEGGDSWYYRYNVGILMKNGEQHIVDVNALTGAIVKVIY